MTSNAFGYNGLDARVSKTDSSGTYGFKRNGAGVTDPVLSDGAATYTPGISERRAGNSKFLHSGMKNADAQGGASANVDSSRTYDAFGNLTGSSGAWSGPFGYAGGFGYQEDPDHGLRLLGHRYYDSSTGRFISKDRIGDGRNWTAYCGNNPVVASDPTGLLAWIPIIAGAIVLLDIIDAYQDAKEIANDPTNPRVYIAPAMGVIDFTPGNLGKKLLKRAISRAPARSTSRVVAAGVVPDGQAVFTHAAGARRSTANYQANRSQYLNPTRQYSEKDMQRLRRGRNPHDEKDNLLYWSHEDAPYAQGGVRMVLRTREEHERVTAWQRQMGLLR